MHPIDPNHTFMKIIWWGGGEKPHTHTHEEVYHIIPWIMMQSSSKILDSKPSLTHAQKAYQNGHFRMHGGIQ